MNTLTFDPTMNLSVVLTTLPHPAVLPPLPQTAGEAPGALVFTPRVAAVVCRVLQDGVDRGVSTVVMGHLISPCLTRHAPFCHVLLAVVVATVATVT